MNSTPRHPHRPRTSPYGPRGGFPQSNVPFPSQPYSTPVRNQQYFPRDQPWSGGPVPPPPAHGQFFTPPPHHLPYSPLSTSSSSPLTPHSAPGTAGWNYPPYPASFYVDPNMPSPVMPPQTKRKRFAPIRGREGRGRRHHHHHHNRPYRGGRGGGRGRAEEGIDAYYDRFMLEDPWKDLLPAEEGDVEGGAENAVSIGHDGEAGKDEQKPESERKEDRSFAENKASSDTDQQPDSSSKHCNDEIPVT